MTDLETLVEKWSKEAGLLLTAPCLPELWKNFARLAIQYAAEEAAKACEAEAEKQADSYSHDGCLAAADAIRERFKAL
jgi:hypothetical protein